jgi:MoaA/NifB/PqqE/SkfB family radical SAM enzyme
MVNPYMDLHRIEFLVTLRCTGKCKHCSIGPRLNQKNGGSVHLDRAVEAIQKLSRRFSVESLMTFGGEPLLYADTVISIHKAAELSGIKKRQLITNGYFSKNPQIIRDTAGKIAHSGINGILISVDTFHQEVIPLDLVRLFVQELLGLNFQKIRLHPAWVVNSLHQNEYNMETRRILESFSDLEIATSNGNDISPAGNAAKYLKNFYNLPQEMDMSIRCGQARYTAQLDQVQSLSIEPNGDVAICKFMIGNIYKDDINDIIDNYNPFDNVMMLALMEGGVKALLEYAAQHGKIVDTSDCYSPCSVCEKILTEFRM